jgi:hypothetical protein
MAEITLARLTRLETRIGEMMPRLEALIKRSNIVAEAATNKVDVDKLIARHSELGQALMNIKNTKHDASRTIIDVLNRRAAKRKELALLRALNTKVHVHNEQVYIAIVNEEDKQKRISIIEDEIDALQDQIDSYNVMKKVQVNDALLEIIKGGA